jgi:hypothetical protein
LITLPGKGLRRIGLTTGTQRINVDDFVEGRAGNEHIQYFGVKLAVAFVAQNEAVLRVEDYQAIAHVDDSLQKHRCFAACGRSEVGLHRLNHWCG